MGWGMLQENIWGCSCLRLFLFCLYTQPLKMVWYRTRLFCFPLPRHHSSHFSFYKTWFILACLGLGPGRSRLSPYQQELTVMSCRTRAGRGSGGLSAW